MSTVEHNDELFVSFLDEAMHGLHGLPEMLANYRQCPSNDAPIHAVFRAIHSIKGNAGFFGLVDIKTFSHSIENTLDDLRNDRLVISETLERALVDGFDVLFEMLHLVQAGRATSELETRCCEILQNIESIGSRCGSLSKEQRIQEIASLAEEIEKAGLAQSIAWSNRLRRLLPHAKEGNGKAAEPAASPDPTSAKDLCNVQFICQGVDLTASIRDLLIPFLSSPEDKHTISTCQSFMNSALECAKWADSHGEVVAAGRLRDAAECMRTILNSPLELDATLLGLVWDALWPAICSWKVSSEPEAASRSDALTASETTTPNSASLSAKGRFLRIREDALEDFVTSVAGLFITCERLKDLHFRMAGEKEQPTLVDELKQINASLYAQTNALQSSVVALRNVPASSLLSKFPRMARTLAGNLGKQVEVTLEGEDLGIDKSLVEDLDAPLTHMVRNVCDHAIEMPEERHAAGKSSCGRLHIKCELTRTHVVLTVRDDGRGIDPDKLRRKAVEKQLISCDQAAALTSQEAVELVFYPGLSTAETITEMSGRGVGMDVVRTTLREHGGDVFVESRLNVGTTFTLKIPIRRAVLVVDGLLVRDRGNCYVVPLEHVREIVEVQPHALKSVQNSSVALVRKSTYSAVLMSTALGEASTVCPNSVYHGIVLKTKEGSVCLLTERVLGQRKIVINSLKEVFPSLEKLTGVAQLGGGRLALVISAPDIVRDVTQQRR